MSAFIEKADYAAHINNNVLDAITQATDAKLNEAETRAIEEMKGYLNSRYDTPNIFNKLGADRNPVILMYAIDMTLYHLHCLINPRKVPEHRKERYQRALEWLEDVSDGRINPPGLPIPTSGDKDYVKWGSNTRRDNHV